jgi:hypothetical protein
MTQQSKIKTNANANAKEYKHANLAFIANHQCIKNKHCRHNPINDVYKGEQVSRESQFPGNYTTYIEQNTQCQSAAEHHE